MKLVNTHEAKTTLSQLLANVENENQTIRICRHGKPIADLIPIPKNSNPLQQHKKLMGAKLIIADQMKDNWA